MADVSPDAAPVIVERGAPSGLVLCCEHADNALPEPIGATPELLAGHRGYDPGSLALSRELLAALGGVLVRSHFSRLYVDLNREPHAYDCIPERMDGVPLPGNLLDAEARAARLAAVHDVYHDTLDRELAAAIAAHGRDGVFLLSIHTFTRQLGDRLRSYAAGVLFDDHDELAETYREALAAAGLETRLNEPYSGYEGLIYSANRHGHQHAVRYLELEVRNDLLTSERLPETAQRVVRGSRTLLTPLITIADGVRS